LPATALAQTIGLSAPLTAAQRPFILWVGGTDLIGYVDKSSYSLDDQDLTQPGMFTFTLTDKNNVVGRYVHKLDEVMWYETLTTGGTGRILYRGFVRQIDVAIVANYGLWTLTCSDVSEMLDYAQPVINDTRPQETTLDRLQYLLGSYGTVSSMGLGGNIEALSGGLIQTVAIQRETLRTAIEKSIALEATLTGTVSYYLDYLYQLHVFYGFGDVAAPYNLTDGTPVPGSSISYSIVATYDGTSDTDGLYVYGLSTKGSGLVSNGVPRWPMHISSTDASTSTSQNTKTQAGLAALGQRQNIIRAQVTVTGYDGWAKGQQVYVTNAVLGLSSVQFWIMGVSMKVLSSTGYREYTLQLNAGGQRFTRMVAPLRGGRGYVGGVLMGQIGG
jgi:hypothetical protein